MSGDGCFRQNGSSVDGTLLRPPGARCGRFHRQHPARSCVISHTRRAAPLPRHHEQRSSVYSAEHASKATAVKLDRLQNLTAFAYPHATLVGDVAVPDGAFGVEAYAVGNAVTEIGPHPSIRQAAISRNVESC